MGRHSRRKGARGERELARLLTAEGFDAVRGRQHRGGPDSPDVRCPDLPRLHWEVARTERLRLYDKVAQAQDEAGEGQVPVVAHRRNRHPWVAILPLEAFLAIIRRTDLVDGGAPEPGGGPTQGELHCEVP